VSALADMGADRVFDPSSIELAGRPLARVPASFVASQRYNDRFGLGVEDTERGERASLGSGSPITSLVRPPPEKKVWEPSR
jgi:hypothetical protein